MIKCEKQSSSNNIVANNHVFLLKKMLMFKSLGSTVFLLMILSRRDCIYLIKNTPKKLYFEKLLKFDPIL